MSEIVAKKHAVLGPSSADRWMTCPGSVALTKDIPNRGSKYAAWGTVAHEVADLALQSGNNAEQYVGQPFSSDGFDFIFDMEMADCVNDYISYVHQFLDPENDTIYSEETVPLTWLTGEEDAEGTSDIIGVTANGKRMVVADLKSGRGVQVDAIDNKQMRIYGLGALKKYEAIYDSVEEVQMVIIQPRLGHVDTEILTVAELRAFGEEVTIAAGIAQLPNAPLVPSEKGCRWCDAKATCPALRGEVMQAVTGTPAGTFADRTETMAETVDTNMVTPSELTELSDACKAVPLVQAWCDAVIERRKALMLDGQNVPGFKLVQGNAGARFWKDPDAAEEALRKRLKVTEAYNQKLISPTQAEAVFKKRPKVWSQIAPLIDQKEGGPVVAPESSKKPEYRIASESGTFSDLTVNADLAAALS